jgi:hypothetical protein
VSLDSAETPGALGSAEEKQHENRPALENVANEEKNCLFHAIFQQPARSLMSVLGISIWRFPSRYAISVFEQRNNSVLHSERMVGNPEVIQ